MTVATPVSIERELAELGAEIERWTELTAYHLAQRDWRKTRLAVAEARAAMTFTGPATKAKYAATMATEHERIDLDIAQAHLGLCEKRLHALDKLVYVTLGRNKSATNSYNLGY